MGLVYEPGRLCERMHLLLGPNCHSRGQAKYNAGKSVGNVLGAVWGVIHLFSLRVTFEANEFTM